MNTDERSEGRDPHWIDPDRLRSWLTEKVNPTITSVDVTRLATGYSSGAWRIDVAGTDLARSLVLKAPTLPSVVFRRDAMREGGIMSALHHQGAPVPEVVAVDERDTAVGRPCFLMEYIESRAVADERGGAHHADGILRAGGRDLQCAVWESFHDALAAMHRVDPREVGDARLGDDGVADMLAYWRASLLDVAPVAAVPRQLAVLDWLAANIPAGADEAPAACIGDARLANALLVGTETRALVDFEVAYIGNPLADVGYSIFFDRLARLSLADPLEFPTPAETWARYHRATGRPLEHLDYWIAFAATILCITATRAIVLWGGATVDQVEPANQIIGLWESAIADAARNM